MLIICDNTKLNNKKSTPKIHLTIIMCNKYIR